MTANTPSQLVEHTPTPWRVSLPDETLIVGPDNEAVTTTYQGDADYDDHYSIRAANAAFIARAANAHDPAMSALRSAYTALAFAFARLHGGALSRDGELCDTFGKVRGQIKKVFRDQGEKL